MHYNSSIVTTFRFPLVLSQKHFVQHSHLRSPVQSAPRYTRSSSVVRSQTSMGMLPLNLLSYNTTGPASKSGDYRSRTECCPLACWTPETMSGDDVDRQCRRGSSPSVCSGPNSFVRGCTVQRHDEVWGWESILQYGCPGAPAWWGRPWVRSGSEVLFNTSSCYKLVYETIFLNYNTYSAATNTHFARLPFVLFFVQQIRSSSSEAQPRNQQGHVAPALIHSIWEVTSWVRW